MSRALHEGLAEEGQSILGGDLAVSLIHRQVSDDELAFLESLGRVGEVAEMRAMARVPGGDAQTLSEVKAVDGVYPLYGELRVAGGGDPAELLGPRDGGHGLLVEPSLAARLDVGVGDAVEIGRGRFVVTGFIESEPDRLSGGGIGWGPRSLMSVEALRDTGLVQPGSLVRWRYRVALPAPASDADVGAAMAAVESRAEESGWQVRSRDNASPGLSNQNLALHHVPDAGGPHRPRGRRRRRGQRRERLSRFPPRDDRHAKERRRRGRPRLPHLSRRDAAAGGRRHVGGARPRRAGALARRLGAVQLPARRRRRAGPVPRRIAAAPSPMAR